MTKNDPKIRPKMIVPRPRRNIKLEAYAEGALHASRLTFEIEGQSRSHGEKESDAPIANYPSGTTKKGFVAESRVRSRVKGLRR